jgi:hypothetical protein
MSRAVRMREKPAGVPGSAITSMVPLAAHNLSAAIAMHGSGISASA